VDVHVRRLRAKLGSEYEAMIGTVRQVGYKFVVPSSRQQLADRSPLTDTAEQLLADLPSI
ncbi:winged helix-turn-helix domain-containing protein, partial [Catellatospora methionotrophica]|uniref:winged helix-turn-helix domain-containing protein n=1 Tax=Catellatospora methionotrophica TaxID=121620 RepID=UPI0033F832A9